MPATYCYNNQHIHMVPDISYKLPDVGSIIKIGDREFEVAERKMMPAQRYKRMWFIHVKDPKKCIK